MPTVEHSSNELNPRKLRFGIFCNSYLLKKWQVKTIEHLLSSGDAELVLLVINTSFIQKEGFLNKINSWFGKHFVYKLYQKFFFHPDSIKEIDSFIKVSKHSFYRLHCEDERKIFRIFFR